MTAQERLDVFRELVSCGGRDKIASWVFDAEGRLVFTDCERSETLGALFEMFGFRRFIAEHAKASAYPLILSLPLGLSCVAAFETEEGRVARVHILGPAYFTEASLQNAEKFVRGLDATIETQNAVLDAIKELPTVLSGIFLQYACMLHYCISGQKIAFSDISYQHSEKTEPIPEIDRRRDRHRVYMIERGILSMVREGNLNYSEIMDRSASISTGIRIDVGDPVRRSKDSAIVFTALCMRAAIEGGLSPDISYSVGDHYVQTIEELGTVSEITAANRDMYKDFVQRVHRCRTNPKLSRCVQSCCDYIESNVENEISLRALAERAGYTPYYLSKKFKKELGVSLTDYVNMAKTERAKLLLTTSAMTVQEISDALRFCSRSYFSDVFKRITGEAPADFRKRYELS